MTPKLRLRVLQGFPAVSSTCTESSAKPRHWNITSGHCNLCNSFIIEYYWYAFQFPPDHQIWSGDLGVPKITHHPNPADCDPLLVRLGTCQVVSGLPPWGCFHPSPARHHLPTSRIIWPLCQLNNRESSDIPPSSTNHDHGSGWFWDVLGHCYCNLH